MACGKNKRKAAPGPLEEGRANKITFTSNQLKIIAAAAMLLDHCAAVFVPYEAPGIYVSVHAGQDHCSYNVLFYCGRILSYLRFK